MPNDNVSITHRVETRVCVFRGQKVLLDTDLAKLYGVEPKRLNEQVKRNLHRFPANFMFQLTPQEFTRLRSQNATAKAGRGGRRTHASRLAYQLAPDC